MSILNTKEFKEAKVGDVITFLGKKHLKFLKAEYGADKMEIKKSIFYYLYSTSTRIDPQTINWCMDKYIADYLIKEVGIKVLQNSFIISYKDSMYYREQKTGYKTEGTRVVYSAVVKYDNDITRFDAEAAPDNVSEWCRKNCGVLARKRALVGAVCRALNIMASIDIMFPDYANYNISSEEAFEDFKLAEKEGIQMDDSSAGIDLGKVKKASSLQKKALKKFGVDPSGMTEAEAGKQIKELDRKGIKNKKKGR